MKKFDAKNIIDNFMKKFDAKNIIDKMAAMSAYTKSFLLPLYSDIIFFIDHYRAGVSNKHCLLPFFILTITCALCSIYSSFL